MRTKKNKRVQLKPENSNTRNSLSSGTKHKSVRTCARPNSCFNRWDLRATWSAWVGQGKLSLRRAKWIRKVQSKRSSLSIISSWCVYWSMGDVPYIRFVSDAFFSSALTASFIGFGWNRWWFLRFFSFHLNCKICVWLWPLFLAFLRDKTSDVLQQVRRGASSLHLPQPTEPIDHNRLSDHQGRLQFAQMPLRPNQLHRASIQLSSPCHSSSTK